MCLYLLISPVANATFFQELLAGCLLERVECFPMLTISESPSLLRLKTRHLKGRRTSLRMKGTNEIEHLKIKKDYKAAK